MTKDPNSKKQTVFKEETNNEKSEEGKAAPSKTGMGLDENIAGALSYLVGFITGIIFLLIEKENHFVRFHALQSIVTFAFFFTVSIVLMVIPLIGWIISILLTPITFVLWLFMMWKAYNGEMFKLPIIGDFVEKQLKKN